MSAKSTTPLRIASKCERSEQDATESVIAVGTPHAATAPITGSKPMIRSRNTSASDTTNPTTDERDRVDANTPIATAAPERSSEPR